MSSWRKTIPFLLFHSCQQQSKTKVSKCALGRLAALPRLRRSQIEAPGQILNPRCSKKLAANGHWKIRCSAVSGELWQRSQVGSATIFFLNRLDLLWSLPCMSSQAKNCTRGGAQERQKVPVLGSGGSLLDLIILYSPDVCRVPFSIANAEFRPSLLSVNTTRDKSSLTVASSSIASAVSRGTR